MFPFQCSHSNVLIPMVSFQCSHSNGPIPMFSFSQVMVDLDSKPSQRQDDLVKLLCSMQSSLLFWCRHVLLATTDSKEGEEGERHSRIMKGTKDVLNQCNHTHLIIINHTHLILIRIIMIASFVVYVNFRVIVLAGIYYLLDVECIQTNCLSILNKVLQKIKNEEDIVSNTVCVCAIMCYPSLPIHLSISPPLLLSFSSLLISPPLPLLISPSFPSLSPSSSPPPLPLLSSPRRLYL